ncbi:MAG: hypothetical protein J0H53_02795 [Rhizobiales bacterium]|nr:hypothetical protein [Hyphomicrobiales bacterium]
MNVMQALYDSEINFSVSTFWDDGFEIKLGDAMNGYRAETKVRTWAEVEPWLKAAALEHFPESGFARRMALRGR